MRHSSTVAAPDLHLLTTNNTDGMFSASVLWLCRSCAEPASRLLQEPPSLQSPAVSLAKQYPCCSHGSGMTFMLQLVLLEQQECWGCAAGSRSTMSTHPLYLPVLVWCIALLAACHAVGVTSTPDTHQPHVGRVPEFASAWHGDHPCV